MKLLTKDAIKKIPKLYSTEKTKLEEKKAVVKFFCPWNSWTWYVVEGQQESNGDWTFWGLVEGFEKEWGYFTLSELMSVKHRSGLMIERDRWFEPTLIKDIK